MKGSLMNQLDNKCGPEIVFMNFQFRNSLLNITVLIILIATLSGCSVSTISDAGNSSQTGNNGVIVAARNNLISGTTQPNARIYIFDQEYRPFKNPAGFEDSTIADSTGSFTLVSSREGRINLLVQNELKGTSGFIANIPVYSDSVFADTLDSLCQPGFLKGKAIDSAGGIFALSYAFIKGSPFYTVTNNNGDFLLGPLPAGRFRIGFFANFKVIDNKSSMTPQWAQLLVEVQDTADVIVYPDSITVRN